MLACCSSPVVNASRRKGKTPGRRQVIDQTTYREGRAAVPRNSRSIHPLDTSTAPDVAKEVTLIVKSVAALPMFALLGAATIALPFASQAKAEETVASTRADRLDIRADCSQQVWPYIASSCLRGVQAKAEVRLVTAVRR